MMKQQLLFCLTLCLIGSKVFTQTKAIVPTATDKPTDKKYRTLGELEQIYRTATAQNNILILNVSPNRDGRIKETDVDLLRKLKEKLKL